MTRPRMCFATLLVAALLVAACDAATPAPSGAGPAPSGAGPVPSGVPSGAPPASGAPVPVVITTDMGMDDLLAVYILLRDPAVDVRAITVDGTGLVHCGPGIRNMRRILVAFGRPDIPFGCGRDDAGADGTPFPDEWRAGSDNMYGVVLPPVVGTETPPEGATLLADTIRTAADPVTIVALGPWTTLQDMFEADPSLVGRVAGIHAMAGAIDVPGNMQLPTISPSDGVEWNVGADPDSFADVLALDIPVSFVPLDATNDVPVPSDILARLESNHTAAGADIAYETYARTPFLAGEGNYWWDGTAAVALSDPELLTWEDARLAISDRGRLARDPAGRAARIATGADTSRVQEAILAGLRRGAPRPEPFATPATLSVTWDGSTCRIDDDPPTTAGAVRLELHNRSASPVGLLGAGVRAPKTWADVFAWVREADIGDPQLAIPDWIVTMQGESPFAAPGADAVSLAQVPAGEVGVICGTGDWPDLELVDGGSITLVE